MGSYRKRKKEDLTNKPTRWFSDKQEKHVANKLNGKQTKNSGATPWQKGDVSIDNVSMLIECKTKTKKSKSITIQKEWLEKIDNEALFMGKKYSALVFNFGPNEKNYAIINYDVFKMVMNTLGIHIEESI
jgi:hypothetical protein